MHTLSLALVLLSAHTSTADAAPATQPTEARLDDERAVAARDRDEKDAEEEMGFFDKYYPFSFDDEYHPEVEKDLVTLYFMELFGMFPWGPYVFHDQTPSLEFVYEMMAIYIIHYILVVPTIYLIWVPIIGWFGVPIWVALNVFYLMPAAILNAYNRDYVRRNGGGDEGGRRRRGGGGSSASLPAPPAVASADEALVAY